MSMSIGDAAVLVACFGSLGGAETRFWGVLGRLVVVLPRLFRTRWRLLAVSPSRGEECSSLGCFYGGEVVY